MSTMPPTSKPDVDPTASSRNRGGGVLITIGLVLCVVALVGWIGTSLVSSFSAGSAAGREDLTEQFRAAGTTDLGRATTVAVGANQTAVVFLIGDGLLGESGTTTGSCSAVDESGRSIDVSDNAHIETTLVDVLPAGKEIVTIAGVQLGRDATLMFTCTSNDSGVDNYVVVASDQATIATTPAWSPWAWIAGGVLGFVLAALGVIRLPRVPEADSAA